MNINKEMLKQLTLTIERKVMTDEIKALEKQLRIIGARLNSINENIEIVGDVSLISNRINVQVTELKKVLKSNDLL